jgi:ubiquinone/menaquinone biosynthesis C-methylase UbiE
MVAMTTTSAPSGFRFDEKTAQQLSMIYSTDDIKEMQRQYRVWFDPRPGERILDVGCGTGVNALAIARLVEPSGEVVAIDNSEPMLKIAREKASAPNVQYQLKAVEDMNFPDESFDGVVGTQLLGYLSDPIPVIRSMLRVVKPRGRVFLSETDWDTLVYSIPDKPLQRRITTCFSDHQGDGWVGRLLHSWCRQAGAGDIELHPYVICNAEYSIRKYGGPLSYVIRDYLLRTQQCTEADVKRWLRLLSEAFDNRTYFFALTRLVCILRK